MMCMRAAKSQPSGAEISKSEFMLNSFAASSHGFNSSALGTHPLSTGSSTSTSFWPGGVGDCAATVGAGRGAEVASTDGDLPRDNACASSLDNTLAGHSSRACFCSLAKAAGAGHGAGDNSLLLATSASSVDRIAGTTDKRCTPTDSPISAAAWHGEKLRACILGMRSPVGTTMAANPLGITTELSSESLLSTTIGEEANRRLGESVRARTDPEGARESRDLRFAKAPCGTSMLLSICEVFTYRDVAKFKSAENTIPLRLEWSSASPGCTLCATGGVLSGPGLSPRGDSGRWRGDFAAAVVKRD
mmetsp:Transcript_25411/g.40744  ORF Transcript_25411/g.40744 Transcript_25411/m.40744 type:complete len:304 (+) Transcript_25411:1527-2438(+)